MKKISYLIITAILSASMLLSFAACNKKADSSSSGTDSSQAEITESSKTENSSVQSSSAQSSAAESSKLPDSDKEDSKPESSMQSSEVKAPSADNMNSSSASTLADALFIGDSRTIGLAEYSGLDSDFFASVGMSVYNIHKKPVPVPGVGKVSLTQLLKNKKYDKIYIMLGINEIGYNTEKTLQKYSELVNLVKQNQPDAYIFIQANLHVTGRKSQSDKYINNKAINRFNSEIAKMADGKTVFYIDINKVFDDADGNLAADKTSDSVHIYAKYYREWADWIRIQTDNILGA